MNATAQYWLARYTPDLFRQEPRNVGVFVVLGDRVAARFLGEREPGRVDGRTLRYKVADFTAYSAWVDFWRASLKRPPESNPVSAAPIRTPIDFLDYLVAASKGQYAVTSGGKVAGVDTTDGVEAVCDFLYRSLVGDENFGTVVAGEEPIVDGRTRLKSAVEHTLRDSDLLGSVEDPLLSQGKVVPGLPVLGTAHEPHRPDFVQQNGRLWVMAVVDFATTQVLRAKEHAGTAAYIFRDLSDKHGATNLSAISLVRRDAEDEPDVRWGLEVLNRHSQIVDWDDEAARDRFVEERRKVAGLLST